MKGIATAASASRSATEVWVKAAGLIRMKAVPSLAGGLDAFTSTCSALDWKASSSSAMRGLRVRAGQCMVDARPGWHVP
jgi:hypothetical protein